MTPHSLLLLILSISALSYLFDQILEILNLNAQRSEIPDEIAGFYDRGKYSRSLEYLKAQTRLGFASSAFTFALSFGMLAFGGFGWLDSALRVYIQNEVLLALAFFGCILVASDILTLPFQLYATFVLEERFEFNKTTVATFIADKLKGYALGAIFGGLLLSLLLFLLQRIGSPFWIWFGLAASLVVLLINLLYTSIILPLFNKLTPLPDGDLKVAIESFAQKVSFPLDQIFVMDGSRRSKKANAFFSGFGRKKKIVLFDTLISNHTTEELVAVLAHEIGHYKRKHIISGYLLSVAQIFFTLFILSLMVFNENLSLALGGHQLGIHLNLVAFGILFAPISAVTGLLMRLYSRRNEFEADSYAREMFSGKALADALKRLSVESLSNLYPHSWYVFFHYSHPPLLERLRAIG